MGLAEEWAVRHTEHRLAAEVNYLENLLAAVPEIVEDHLQPRPRKEKHTGKAEMEPSDDA